MNENLKNKIINLMYKKGWNWDQTIDSDDYIRFTYDYVYIDLFPNKETSNIYLVGTFEDDIKEFFYEIETFLLHEPEFKYTLDGEPDFGMSIEKITNKFIYASQYNEKYRYNRETRKIINMGE